MLLQSLQTSILFAGQTCQNHQANQFFIINQKELHQQSYATF